MKCLVTSAILTIHISCNVTLCGWVSDLWLFTGM